MTIPGRGDLAPPRRHRPVWRYVTALVVLAIVAGGGYVAYQGLTGSSSPAADTTLPVCPKGAGASRPPKPPQSKVTVNNASLITGLAGNVAAQLKHRGFAIGRIGNAAKVGKGIATVHYSADRRLEATRLTAQVPGARMAEVPGSHVVELDINPKFTTLASKAAARNAYRRAVASQHLASPSPTPSASPTCRAAHKVAG